ncbi:wax ester/triacylglycerol synthase family O-acyltransferase [Mycolicibacterium peregrinum]|uniref:wax ester/triacylglycerol synthase family O-acyltransferase n=1 Tax=Mycolicibacterium peregrinum TaxID=43304 RepID=UPI0006D77AE8|nr:wax ester/triacylglycerol synthase family O-acyltransferase [Mycolicibacterium peregrinum]MCV7204293.1 wax ester/triacylglycerol synthase family O-acyltransferase [Mycolicibacterium peregrinum]ORW50680.1 diacylglycerol O-acyltransferase [Mycolicibacterium peregrinum]
MERLTALDAAFLEAEDADSKVSLAMGVLSIVEGPLPDYPAVLDGIAERLTPVPRFTQVIRRQPFDLSAPKWVDDDNFSVERHVRRIAVPAPGDDAALFGVVADLMERRLDRDRPLWECWVIDRLVANRWAILMKIHHCIADGIATAQLLARLSDESSGDSFVSDIRATKEPPHHRIPILERTLSPVRLGHELWDTACSFTQATAQAAQGAVQIATGLLSANSSSLTGPVTGLRRHASAQVSLADVGRICQAFDVTINDVALAAVTDSYRAAMIRRGEQPRDASLRTLVPVSMRRSDALDRTDNRVSLMLPCLPVDEYDPVRQLRVVHRRLQRAKSSGQSQAGSLFVSAVSLVPFGVTAMAMRALIRLPQQSVVTVATNVPGPRQHLRLLGHRVVRVVPIPPIALGLRTGFAILSYADDLVFGITADYDAVPDVNTLAADIQRAVARLAALATGSMTPGLREGDQRP